MRQILLSLSLLSFAQTAQAEMEQPPVSLDAVSDQLFRIAVDPTRRTDGGGSRFVVTVTPIDAIDGMEPEFTDTRYVTYLQTSRTPLVMDGINDMVSQTVWTYCRERFGADHFPHSEDAVPSSVTDSFTASGACFQAPY